MYLLDTTSQTLKSFPDDRNLTYAILSHRWTDEEVTFEDLKDQKNISALSGWSKLISACQQAQADGYAYIWIDSCCIEKKSSAELSEAINSMYRWYQNAAVCYAYLLDVEEQADVPNSVWFTRGWTLQELIAPRELVFYNSNWEALASRTQLAGIISKKTQISETMLRGYSELEDYSIAQRMAWASSRYTTRAEDMAYSLMGLFDIQMPVLYGEGGRNAFLRLQQEIIKGSADQTIFAWKLSEDSKYRGLLAHSTAEFAGCGLITRGENTNEQMFQETNLGLQIAFPYYPYEMNVYHVALEAWDGIKQTGIFLGHPFNTGSSHLVGRRRNNNDEDRDTFYMDLVPESQPPAEFIIPRWPFRGAQPEKMLFGFHIGPFELRPTMKKETYLFIGAGIDLITRPHTWEPKERMITLFPGSSETAVAFGVRNNRGENQIILKIGFYDDFRPWAWVHPPSSLVDILPKVKKDSQEVSLVNRKWLDPSRGEVCSSSQVLQTKPPPQEKAHGQGGYYCGDSESMIEVSESGLRFNIMLNSRSPRGLTISMMYQSPRKEKSHEWWRNFVHK